MQPNQNPDAILENDSDTILIDSFDAEAMKGELTTSIAKKKAWREKFIKRDEDFKKTAEELASLKAKYENPQIIKEEKPDEKKPSSNQNSDWLFDNVDVISSLNSTERGELRQTARELGVDPITYIKSRAGQAELTQLRAKTQSQATIPSPSNQVPTFNGKSVKDILISDKSTSAEKQAAYESRVRGNRGANQTI